MRVTNNMIMKNAASNINSTKELVNKRNTQMTSQKKISKPSDDPVIAVRSLRLSTTLSQVNQYYQKNIPDATSWLDVTETALTNIRSIMADCRELAVTGSTDTYNQTDRNTMLNQLQALQKQLYAEGNSDYAGRTVFTGYRTDRNLTFTENETTTKYEIAQTISVADLMEEHRYYYGDVTIPTNQDELNTLDVGDIDQRKYYRIRLNYDDVKIMDTDTYYDEIIKMMPENEAAYDALKPTNGTLVFKEGLGKTAVDTTGVEIKIYANEMEWENEMIPNPNPTAEQLADPAYDNDADLVKRNKYVGSKEVVVIESTGDIILGDDIAAELMKKDASVSVAYTKEGFDEGELRPEYYYNCIKTYDLNEEGTPIEYTKFDDEGKVISFDIQYTIAADQTININTEASNVFDSSLQRDLTEMIEVVQASLDAHEKVEKIKAMKEEAQYDTEAYQAKLNDWLDAAQKEADYVDDNMQKLFSTELGKIDTYYAKINLALTDIGCKTDSLTLTKTRVGDQQETVQELQSSNDDIDLSQIIIEYTAAYTAYQASLTAAGKLSESTLLNYI